VISSYSIRHATAADAALIARHRRSMFRDMGEKDEAKLTDLEARTVPWTEQRINAGDYMGLLAVAADGAVAAGIGMWLVEWQPSTVSSGRRAMFLNVYTEPEHRRRGLARMLMEAALAWCRENKIQVAFLHASDDGRPLYAALGFKPTSEMRLIVRQD